MEESDKLIAVSGVLFLVAVTSFEFTYDLYSSGFLTNCPGLVRFARALVLGVSGTGSAISAILSFWYFKRFSQRICKDFELA